MYAMYAILKDHLGGWASQNLQTVAKGSSYITNV